MIIGLKIEGTTNLMPSTGAEPSKRQIGRQIRPVFDVDIWPLILSSFLHPYFMQIPCRIDTLYLAIKEGPMTSIKTAVFKCTMIFFAFVSTYSLFTSRVEALLPSFCEEMRGRVLRCADNGCERANYRDLGDSYTTGYCVDVNDTCQCEVKTYSKTPEMDEWDRQRADNEREIKRLHQLHEERVRRMRNGEPIGVGGL